MSSNNVSSVGTRNAFDSWASISAAIILSLIGYTVMVAMPVLSTALVDKVGFTEVQVGRIWGADLGGLSIGAILAAFTVARVNRRLIVLIGVALSIVANLLCLTFAGYEQLLFLRVLAGIGSGIFTAVAVVTLGGTTRPVIAFNLQLFGFAISTALELHFLPQLAMNEIYIFFAILAAVCAGLVRFIPSRPSTLEELAEQERHEDHKEDFHVPLILPILCLVAVCFTYINIGGYYAYIELAAHADGVLPSWTGPVLTWSSICAVIGCVLAFLATRYGLFRPLFISLIAMFACVAMLSFGINNLSFFISIFSFMTLWTFIDVYQSAMLSHMDRKGTLVALLPSVQGFGNFLGPNVSASVLDAKLGYGTLFAVSGAMALVALGLYVTVSLSVRTRDTAPASST